MARIQLEQEKCLTQTWDQVGLCFVHLGNCFSQALTFVKGAQRGFVPSLEQTRKAGCKTPPGELPATFPGTPGFGTSSAFGNELGKAGKQSLWKIQLALSPWCFLFSSTQLYLGGRRGLWRAILPLFPFQSELSLSWWLRWFLGAEPADLAVPRLQYGEQMVQKMLQCRTNQAEEKY